MGIEQIKEIANAVLYEGYLLYPYRHSAIKNRQRWTFGVVYPRRYSEANGDIEPWTMRTECLVAGQAGTPTTLLDVHVRFLHLLLRTVVPHSPPAHHPPDGVCRPGVASSADNASEWSLASRLANEPWEEGIEREVSALDLSLSDLVLHPRHVKIEFPAGRMIEQSTDGSAAEIVRTQQPIAGAVVIAAKQVGTNLFKLSVQIENTTPEISADVEQYMAQDRRDAIVLQSFVSTHAILRVRQGSFISLLEPPEELQALAQGCQNLRTWPVLVGNEGERDTMLSSPIILYDYPQIAPESPGALFDGTEIDEILTLRIMTLTDEEKQQMRQGDERAREILERTESLSPEQFMKLHGTIRNLRPVDRESIVSKGGEHEVVGAQFIAPEREGSTGWNFPGEDYPPPASVLIAGREVRAGHRVRLHPKVRADAIDMLIEGKTARIEAIQQDFENRIYLVVTLDDDPGREQWDERVLPGHRFYFFPEEVELLDDMPSEGGAWKKL